VPVSAATEGGLQGVSAELAFLAPGTPLRLSFSADLAVSGTERLQFLPFAKSTHVKLSSSWPTPSFSGAFSPDAAPQIGPHGFAADWRVLQINRDYPQFWTDGAVADKQVEKSAFGVDFYQPVDTYQRDYRATHYAVLFIALTFMALFLWEHTLGAPIHAMQYAMTGAALSVFYLVLLAVSEHLEFAASYALAASAMTGLLSFYFSGVLKSRAAGWVTGALAIFFLLATIMVGTRKLDWYRVPSRAR
jgi:inner membrane protein